MQSVESSPRNPVRNFTNVLSEEPRSYERTSRKTIAHLCDGKIRKNGHHISQGQGRIAHPRPQNPHNEGFCEGGVSG